MPAGAGYIDAQGIYRYGELDERPLASDLLDLLAASISAQLQDIRDEIQAVRDLATPQTYTTAPVAPTSLGSSHRVTKLGRIVIVQLHLTRLPAAPFTATQGLCQLPAPLANQQLRPIVSWYGSGALGHLILTTSGQLQTDASIAISGATVLHGLFVYVSAS